MKTISILGVAMLFLIGGLAHAQGITRMKPPNPNVQMLNGPVCANGFTESRVSGTPNGTHRFVCAAPPIRCPAPLTTTAGPIKRLGAQAAQFSYNCSWTTAAQQQVPQAGVCTAGFTPGHFVSTGGTSTMTGTNSAGKSGTGSSITLYRGSFDCTGAPVQCPAPSAPNIYHSFSPEAGTSPSNFAAFSYVCSYSQVN